MMFDSVRAHEILKSLMFGVEFHMANQSLYISAKILVLYGTSHQTFYWFPIVQIYFHLVFAP